MKRLFVTMLLFCTIFSFHGVKAANMALTSASEDSLTFSFNGDLVSRYLWRGTLLSPNPNIQPYASLSYKGLTFGAWASYGISTPYAETDLYLSYSVGPLTLTVNDYYTASDDDLPSFNYLNYKKNETIHSFEGVIGYEGPESFPISITAATIFGGADDYDGDGDNDFSTYLEVAYNAEVSGVPIKLFIGGTPQKGLYSDAANIVNIGISATKTLKVNDSFEIPVFTSLVLNPNSEDLFFVFGITF